MIVIFKKLISAVLELLCFWRRKEEALPNSNFFKCDEILCNDDAIKKRAGLMSDEEWAERRKNAKDIEYDHISNRVRIKGIWYDYNGKATKEPNTEEFFENLGVFTKDQIDRLIR